MSRFNEKLNQLHYRLTKKQPEVLQVNLGKLCNMACNHCHIEAGPHQTNENMDRSTAEAVVSLLKSYPFKTLDLTGGAPELNPNFKFLVSEAVARSLHVIDRCNLTIFFEKGYQDIPAFLAQHAVEIIASLPSYQRDTADRQRGRGSFASSIEALLLLNKFGYGKPDSVLKLNLVYNPTGPHLPAPEPVLEAEYKQRLSDDFGIQFNRLFTMTNMPITRFRRLLEAKKLYAKYTELLEHNFNPETLDFLMCRNTLNVRWDGQLFDCDFNQALGQPVSKPSGLTVFNFKSKDLSDWMVNSGDHCFGCTAGAGSSCQGILIKDTRKTEV